MKEQMTELVGILRHSESRRREMEKQLKQREQTAPMATTPPVRFLSASYMKETLLSSVSTNVNVASLFW